MAILLVHLRRLILLLSIVYLLGTTLKRLLTESRHAPLMHLNGKLAWSKQLHVQWWAYVYTIYAYLVLVNYVHFRRITNMLDFFFS